MPQWLLKNEDLPLTLRLPPGAVKTIGRTSLADFVVNEPLVSRLHCRLTTDASDQLVVEDLESTNGTLVNGTRVDRAVLREGDVVTIGRLRFAVSR